MPSLPPLHEYEHVLIYSQIVKAVGHDETDREINDEARGGSAGASPPRSPSSQEVTASCTGRPGKMTPLLLGSPSRAKRRYSDAFFWAQYLGGKSTAAYLRERGRSDLTILSNDAAGMNAFLSACRAMTQAPMDLTACPYPSSQIQYVPFFPDAVEP